MRFIDDFTRQARRNGTPGTTGLVLALATSYVLSWFTHAPFFFKDLGWFGSFSAPWGLLTYPFASGGGGGDFIFVILMLFWLYSIGGGVERDLRTARFLLFFFITVLLGALSVLLGALISSKAVVLAGPLIPVCAMTVAWAVRNASANVQLMFVLSVPAKWMILLVGGIVLFQGGSSAPLIGAFALIPLALAYAFASDKLPGLPYLAARVQKASKSETKRAGEYFTDVHRREKEREERERLRKLFEGSLGDDK